MKIAISSKGNHLDAPFASVTSDAAYYLIVDSKTLHYKVIENSDKNCLQFKNRSILEKFVKNNVEIVVCGKNCTDVIEELYHAGIRVYHSNEGSLRDTINAFNESRLISCVESNFIHNKTNYNPEYSFDTQDLMEVLAGFIPDKNEIVNTLK